MLEIQNEIEKEMLLEQLKETPDMIPFVIRAIGSYRELIEVANQIMYVDEFWSTDKKYVEAMFDKAGRLGGKKEPIEILRGLNSFFDWLLKVKEKGMGAKLERVLKVNNSSSVNSAISLYLNSFEELEADEEKQESVGLIKGMLRKNLLIIQEMLQDVIRIDVRNKILGFENKDRLLLENEKKKELEVFEYKKLPAMSKLNKDEFMRLVKGIGFYQLEDARKIIDSFLKKYKFEDLPLNNNVKEKYALKTLLKGVPDSKRYIDIDCLMGESTEHPKHPFFPLEAMNFAEFSLELKGLINELPLENVKKVVIKKTLSMKDERFELSDEEKEFFEAVQKERRRIISDFVDVESINFIENARKHFMYSEKYDLIGEEFTIYEVINLNSILTYVRKGRFGHSDNDLLMLDVSKEYSEEQFRNYQMSVFLEKKERDAVGYELLLGKYADEYSIDNVIGFSDRNQYKNEFFEDVLIYKMKNGLLSVAELKIISGEKFSHYSSYENQLMSKMKGNKEVQVYMLRELERIKANYEDMEGTTFVTDVLVKTMLDRRNAIFFFAMAKPKLVKNLLMYTGYLEGTPDVKRAIENMSDEEIEDFFKILR